VTPRRRGRARGGRPGPLLRPEPPRRRLRPCPRHPAPPAAPPRRRPGPGVAASGAGGAPGRRSPNHPTGRRRRTGPRGRPRGRRPACPRRRPAPPPPLAPPPGRAAEGSTAQPRSWGGGGGGRQQSLWGAFSTPTHKTRRLNRGRECSGERSGTAGAPEGVPAATASVGVHRPEGRDPRTPRVSPRARSSGDRRVLPRSGLGAPPRTTSLRRCL